MWVYTKNGFYSACENKDDKDIIHVRSQFRGDLEHLKESVSGCFHSEISETPYGDYRFRMDVSRHGWNVFMSKESDGINYEKFKPSVKDKSELRKECYLTVFNEMMRAGRESSWAEYLETNMRK